MGAAVANATRKKKRGATVLMIKECVEKRVCRKKRVCSWVRSTNTGKNREAGRCRKTTPWKARQGGPLIAASIHSSDLQRVPLSGLRLLRLPMVWRSSLSARHVKIQKTIMIDIHMIYFLRSAAFYKVTSDLSLKRSRGITVH